MEKIIRPAENKDIADIGKLLNQVLQLHHNGRPDIFKDNGRKYADNELREILKDGTRPIFVCCENERVLGYAFCIITDTANDNILEDRKSLYIDDLCVDKEYRGRHIGRQLYDYVLDFAKTIGCQNVTLNVWSFNEGAVKFYESCGMKPLKTVMETVL